MQSQRQDPVGKGGEGGAEKEGDGEEQQAFEQNQTHTAHEVPSRVTGQNVGHGSRATHHQNDVGGEHPHETQPFSNQHLPAADRLRRHRVDGAGGDFARKRINGGEHGHRHGQQIDGVKTHHQHGVQDLAADEHGARREVLHVIVEPRAEQSEKREARQQSHPEQFLSSGLAKRHAREDPRAHHRPPSLPTISRNSSSSDCRSGVNS